MQFDSLQFLQSIPEAFCVLDESWCYIFVNAQAERLLGKSKEELLGKRIWDIFPESENSPFYTEMQRIAVERIAGEFCALSASLQRWLSVRAYPVDEGLAFIVDYSSETHGRDGEIETRESYFRLLLNSTGEGIYAVDTNGKCTFINKAGAALLGFQPDELLGKRMHKLTHHTRANGTSYPPEECHIYRAFRGAQEVQVEDEVFWRKDNSRFAVEYSSYPVRLNGTMHGAVVAFNDITKRKATELALKESEERFRSLVTTTAQIVWTTLPSGEFTIEQNEWSRFTGQGSSQASDWGWLEVVHPDDRERTKSTWLAAVSARTTYQHEHRLRRYDGLYRYMTVKAVPVTNINGTIREWIGIHTDITDRKTADLERERLLSSEQKVRKEAEASKFRALSLAGELSIERDKLNLSNNKLQELVDDLEKAGKSLYEKQERQALITRFLRAANKLAAQITGAHTLSEKFEGLVNSAAFFPLMEKERLIGVIAAFSRHELPIEGADIIGTMAAVLAASMQSEKE